MLYYSLRELLLTLSLTELRWSFMLHSKNDVTSRTRRNFLKHAAWGVTGGYLIPTVALSTSRGEGPARDVPRKLTPGAPQIFVDMSDVEEVDNIQQRFHTAEKHPNNPVIFAQHPWERAGGGPCASVIYDDEEKIFKCWYQGVLNNLTLDKHGYNHYGPKTLNYAVSDDGVHWQRPKLRLHEVLGTLDNNVVVPPTYHDGKDHWESVLKDSMDADPQRRYKGFGWSSKTGGLHTMTSPDGLNWTHSPNIVVPGGDAQSMMIDTLKRRYVVMVRGGSPRGVHYSTDFVHWSERDNGGIHWPHTGSSYNHMGFVYGDTYLGFVSWFFRNKESSRFPLLEHHLLHSLDGLHFRMVHQEAATVPCGIYGDWDRFMTLMTGAPPPRFDDKLYIYYRGFSRRHKPFGLRNGYSDSYEAGGIGLATIRADGFASLDAGFDGGSVTTKPMIFSGATLKINAKANFHASVLTEVLDERDQPLAPYTLENCTPMTADSVSHTVTWKTAENVQPLSGRPVKLRFRLTNARLYSYQVV